MTLTIEQRVMAARELLSGWNQSEFDSLSVECRVDLVEAIEHLERFDATDSGGIKK